MHRIDSTGHVGNLFSEGNAATGQAATRVSAAWLNDLQENVCRAITGAGISLVKGNYNQLTLAIQALAEAAGGDSGNCIRFCLPGAVAAAAATRLVAALAGKAGNIVRVGARLGGGSGTATVLVKNGANTVATLNASTTGVSASGSALANIAVSELSVIGVYVSAISGAPQELMVFAEIEGA